jgi:hypothetical protein
MHQGAWRHLVNITLILTNYNCSDCLINTFLHEGLVQEYRCTPNRITSVLSFSQRKPIFDTADHQNTIQKNK